ncbi:MAG: hypothetical protein D6798_00890 [Deltaproteobacteria bacterium]|nr:MAG: hypothetical protein D6798_00890 [Deltaproteobacteria bacterium]
MPDYQQQVTTPATDTSAPTTSAPTTSTGIGNSAGQGNLVGSSCDPDRLNDIFDAISDKYTQILMERAAGVEELRQDASVEDPPPAWQSIAIAVGSVALATATAGVGTLVAGRLVEASAKVANAMVKTALDKGLQTAITGAINAAGSNPATNVTDAFFRAQSASLRDASATVQDTWNLSGRAEMRRAEDPCAAAMQLFQALEEGRKAAKMEQRRETLASWCNFQARGELGTYHEGQPNAGTDLGSQLGDTSAKGVLGLEVTAGASSNSPVQVEDAEIEGLNETLRGELASRPIGQLGIPITVHGQVDPPAWYENRPARGTLRFGENESGTRWKRNSPGGADWLVFKGVGGPVLTGPEGLSQSDRDQYEWQGIAKVLDNEIKPKSLRSIGVTLDG